MRHGTASEGKAILHQHPGKKYAEDAPEADIEPAESESSGKEQREPDPDSGEVEQDGEDQGARRPVKMVELIVQRGDKGRQEGENDDGGRTKSGDNRVLQSLQCSSSG